MCFLLPLIEEAGVCGIGGLSVRSNSSISTRKILRVTNDEILGNSEKGR